MIIRWYQHQVIHELCGANCDRTKVTLLTSSRGSIEVFEVVSSAAPLPTLPASRPLRI